MLSYGLCQCVRRILACDVQPPFWSRCATAALEELRADYAWATSEATSIVRHPNGEIRWWTFGGAIVNALLADDLRSEVDGRADNFCIRFPAASALDAVERRIAGMRAEDVHPVPNAAAIEQMKFAECLPRTSPPRSSVPASTTPRA
jgi:ATP-dependent Lhr-like helicase